MSNPEHRADSYRMIYEIRNVLGVVVQTGEAFGAKSWLDHKNFSRQNAIKRVKTVLNMKWGTKTLELNGTTPGEIARRFEDGNTLHIWVLRDEVGTASNEVGAYTPEIEGKLLDDAVARLMNDGDFNKVAAHLHKQINSYAQDEEIRLQTIKDMLNDKWDEVKDMFG